MAERGTLKVTIGGVSRSMRVEIAVAPEIEEATGRGVVALTRDILTQSARFVDVVEIIRVVLKRNGITYTSAEMLAAVEKEGILASMHTAGRILNELFRTPEGTARSGKAPAAVLAETTSH